MMLIFQFFLLAASTLSKTALAALIVMGLKSALFTRDAIKAMPLSVSLVSSVTLFLQLLWN
jgi:hypothetical protein